jgi:uncharacterized membrane protein
VTDQQPAATPRIRPRIRTAAVVWGLILVALGTGLAWFVLDPSRVTDAGLRLLDASGGDVAFAVVGLVLVVGAIVLIGSLLAIAHRAQDRGRARHEEAIPAPASAPDEA